MNVYTSYGFNFHSVWYVTAKYINAIYMKIHCNLANIYKKIVNQTPGIGSSFFAAKNILVLFNIWWDK